MSSSKIIQTRYKVWRIGSTFQIQPGQVKQLIRLTDHASNGPVAPLEGRSPVVRTLMDGIGPVVLKKYFRGGLIKKILKDQYFKIGPCRAELEFKVLLKAGNYGINVPRPVCYFQKGDLLYQCWLLTKEIPNNGSIAQICLADPGSVQSLMRDVTRQVKKMITKGIYHVDFHPGNVLAGQDGKIYLLDFDKAIITKMDKIALEKKYVERWNRAVLKHHLPKRLLQDSFFNPIPYSARIR